MRSRDHLQVAESACTEDNGSAVAYVETSTVQQMANGSRSRRCLDRAAAQLGFARKFRSSGLGNLLSMLHETLRHGSTLFGIDKSDGTGNCPVACYWASTVRSQDRVSLTKAVGRTGRRKLRQRQAILLQLARCILRAGLPKLVLIRADCSESLSAAAAQQHTEEQRVRVLFVVRVREQQDTQEPCAVCVSALAPGESCVW